MIQILRTVLNHHEVGEVLAQILHSLGLTCTGWTLGSSSTPHVKGIGQSHVGTISQWSDDQTAVVALVLVSVVELCVELPDLDLHELAAVFGVLVVSQLRLPFEVHWSVDSLVGVKLLDNLTVVLLHDDEGDNLQAVYGAQASSFDALGVDVDLSSVGSLQLLEWIRQSSGVFLQRQGRLDVRCPLNSRTSEKNLSLVFGDDRGLLFLVDLLVSLAWLHVLSDEVIEGLHERFSDVLLELLEPVLNLVRHFNVM